MLQPKISYSVDAALLGPASLPGGINASPLSQRLLEDAVTHTPYPNAAESCLEAICFTDNSILIDASGRTRSLGRRK